ncbi:MAG: NAD(P)-binding domain-containing protein, partial [Actinomycetota bacterium]|nr:NAD(P)-binding domain-containing protein [Actinomycetota bacterium]
MNIGVIGAGYVGLVTAAGLAALGHRVRVGEADATKLALLQAGGVPLHEAGLEQVLTEVTGDGRLTFHGDNREAVSGSRVVVIALPTPPAPDGSADLSVIEAALCHLASALEAGVTVAVKSTVPVGSAERFQRCLDSN